MHHIVSLLALDLKVGTSYCWSWWTNPKSCITAVDGNPHNFAFSFAKFLEIQLKFAIHLDVKPNHREDSEVWNEKMLIINSWGWVIYNFFYFLRQIQIKSGQNDSWCQRTYQTQFTGSNFFNNKWETTQHNSETKWPKQNKNLHF